MNNVVRIEPAPLTGTERAKALMGALLCALLLLNITGGWIEIPDCLPVVGNLDEVALTVLLLHCLAQLGLNTMPWQR
jgi:hypothetical protein